MKVADGIAVVLFLASFSVACQSNDPTLDAEANDLGVTYLIVDRSEEANDSILTIRGYDSSDEAIAELRVRTGVVEYSWDPDIAPPTPSMGREATIKVRGETASAITPDVTSWQLRFGWQPGDAFVGLAAVRQVLETEVDITPENRTPSGESAYFISLCSNRRCWHSSLTAYGFNVDEYGSIYHATGLGAGSLVKSRQDGPGACRTSSGGTSCTGTACYYGPCGYSLPTTLPGQDGTKYPISYADYDEWGYYFVGGYGTSSGWVYPNVLQQGACTCTNCTTGGVATPSGCINRFSP